jgi:hypothetical protein
VPKLDKQDQRIANIFGTKNVPDVDTETLERYLDHLKQHLEFPCQLTGIEDFDWEEYYVIGPGSKGEHARLRKTRPSYMDIYELLCYPSAGRGRLHRRALSHIGRHFSRHGSTPVNRGE